MVQRWVFTHRAVLAAALLLIFYLIGHYTFGKDQAKGVFDSLLVGASLAVSLNMRRMAWAHIKRGMPDGSSNMIVTVWLTHTLLFIYFLYVVMYTVILGRPAWLMQSPFAGMVSVLFFVSSATAVLTPINTAEKIERVSFWRWTIAVAAGGMLAGGLIVSGLLGLVNQP
jgi:hypothetical protein